MTQRLVVEFYSEVGARRIPTTPGLYAFYLRPLTPSALGLLHTGPPTVDEARRLRERIATLADKIIRFVRASRLSGQISDTSRAPHMAMTFHIVAEQLALIESVSNLVKRLPDQELRPVLNLLGQTALFAQPIYVGITLSQTLADRYEQHRQNHASDLEDFSTFGGRLRAAGFEWRNVVFGCMPVRESEISATSLEFLEKYFQALSTPALSVR